MWAVKTVLTVGERAGSFKAVSPGLLPPLGIIFGLFVAFTAAQVGLGYVVWKYRDRGPGDRAVYTHGSNRLEVVWTVVTAVIFISLAVMGQSVWASLHFNRAPAGAFQVEGMRPL